MQRFDTAARLASAVTRRRTPSPPEPKPVRTPSSTLGQLFRKYSRAKLDGGDAQATPKDQAAAGSASSPRTLAAGSQDKGRAARQTARHEASTESLELPRRPPPPTSPLPPVPPLPSSVAELNGTPGAAYKAKKPRGLRVETASGRRLQKPGSASRGGGG